MKAVPPFLLVPPEAVSFSSWELWSGGDWSPLPDVMAEWDYNTDLHLRRVARIDLAAARSAAALPDDAPLNWLVSWRATDSKLAGSAPRHPVVDGATMITVILPGRELGAALDLFSRLLLAADIPGTVSPGAARHAGSILAEHVQRLVLQGQLGQFPVALVDFAACGLDAEASFVVEMVDDPSAPVLAGLQLLINKADQALVAAVSGYDTSPAASGLLAVLEEQVAVQVIDHVVRHAEEFLFQEWDDDTIGQVGLELVRRIDRVPGLRALAELRESSTSAYLTLLVGEARRNGLGRRISS